MKDYKIVLISFVLLIFLIGAVSASDVDSSDSAIAASDEDTLEAQMLPIIQPGGDDIIPGGGDEEPIDVEVDTKEIYVNDTGDDSNLGTKESPYATVSKAFSQVNASNDATIYIGEGTFLLDGTTKHYIEDYGDGEIEEWDETYNGLNIDLDHKLYGGSLKFIGAGADKTFLDGQSMYYFANIYANSNVTIKDITFINCKQANGGTISCTGNVTIDNCVFKDSTATNQGGVIKAEGSSTMSFDIITGTIKLITISPNVQVSNSEFISCSAPNGGAIYATQANLYLDNNRFINTTCTNNGVAIMVQNSKDTKINKNKFINLTGKNDASLYLQSASTITGNEFINCSTPSETYSIVTLYSSSHIFENNIFTNSTNSVGNVYCGGSMNKVNFDMDYTVINVSNAEINKGFTLDNVNVTDDMGNVVKVNSITVKLINGETTISRSASISDGQYKVTFAEVPENGIYNLTLQFGDSVSDVLALVNITLSNDPVEFWVSPTGFDGNEGTQAEPFATIQHAIDAGFDKSFTVVVHLVKGTYSNDGNVELTIANKGDLQILGEKYGETIIDGGSQSWFLAVSTTNVNITNLKFINGYSYQRDLISGGNKLYLENCIMDNNSVGNGRAGLSKTKFDKLVYTNNVGHITVDSKFNITDSYFIHSGPQYSTDNGLLRISSSASGITIKNCQFVNNTETYSGGAVSGSYISINNLYENNHAKISGGAIWITGESTFINDTFINNYAPTGGVFSFNIPSNNPSSAHKIIFEGCKFINNSADYGGVAALRVGKFTNCEFINNSADYGGVFYLVPYIKVVEDDNNNEEEEPVPIIILGAAADEPVLGAQILPIIDPIPIIDPTDEPVEEEKINSLELNNCKFENNVARLNGNDIYLNPKIPNDYSGGSSNKEMAYAISLTITFNSLNVTSLVDDLTATVYGPCGAVIGADYLSFELNGTTIGTPKIVNSVAEFNYAGFEEGNYIFNGTTEYPNAKYIINPGLISVKLDNIVDHVDMYVAVNGSDENGDGSKAKPFKSISKAMKEAVKNCRDITINIGEGVYAGDLNTALTISSMSNITLAGEGEKTIIDGENTNYFAKITEGNNKVTLKDLTIKNMLPANVPETGAISTGFKELTSPITVVEGANLYLDGVVITNCRGGMAIIENYGNVVIDNSVFSKNGLSYNGIIAGGNVSIDNTLLESNFASFGLLYNINNLLVNNSIIKNNFNLDYYLLTGEINMFTGIMKWNTVIENTEIISDGDNSSLSILGYNATYNLYPTFTLGGNLIANNISMINNYASPIPELTWAYYDGYKLAALGHLYGSAGKNVSVTNSTFVNLDYIWSANTYGQIMISLDGCLFDNLTMIAQSMTPGEGSQYNITNSVFINCDSVIDRCGRSDRDDPNCTFTDNYWGSNDQPVVTYVNPGKAQSFEPATWIILVDEEGVPVFKATDGENVTAYEGSLPAEISYVADEEGNVIPVLNLAGTGYKLSVDENGSVSVNTTAPMKNIVPKVAVNETVFAEDMTVLLNDGSKFQANFTDKWGDPLKETLVSFKVGDKTINATTDSTGVAAFPIDFALGEYIVVVANPVTGQSIDRTIKVLTMETTFASDVNATYNDKSKFEAKFTDEFGVPLANAKVAFIVNNNTINEVTDANGTASFTIDLDAGNYTVTVTNPATGQVVTKSVIVSPLATKLTTSKLTMVYNTGKYLIATLTDADGNILTNQSITITIKGKNYNRITNANGQVGLKIGLAVGKYYPTITFKGTNNYVGSSATAKVVVVKAKPKLAAKKAVAFKAKTKVKKVLVVLKDNKGKAIKKAKVSIKVKGVKYSAFTNKKGQAVIKITKLTKKGTFKTKAIFLGNNNFKSAVKAIKIIVK